MRLRDRHNLVLCVHQTLNLTELIKLELLLTVAVAQLNEERGDNKK